LSNAIVLSLGMTDSGYTTLGMAAVNGLTSVM